MPCAMVYEFASIVVWWIFAGTLKTRLIRRYGKEEMGKDGSRAFVAFKGRADLR